MSDHLGPLQQLQRTTSRPTSDPDQLQTQTLCWVECLSLSSWVVLGVASGQSDLHLLSYSRTNSLNPPPDSDVKLYFHLWILWVSLFFSCVFSGEVFLTWTCSRSPLICGGAGGEWSASGGRTTYRVSYLKKKSDLFLIDIYVWWNNTATELMISTES